MSKDFEYENDDSDLDPRIQDQLERLNQCSIQNNELESRLDDARESFRSLLADTSTQLDNLSKKLGVCVEKARPYYASRKKANDLLVETQAAALRFERACEMLSSAKEMVATAENRGAARGPLDPAWQEMLNHAIIKVNDAELDRSARSREHSLIMARFMEAESETRLLERELRSSIKKSRAYFELKARTNAALEEQKQRCEHYQEKVDICKNLYAEALRSLEDLSNGIHERREEARIRAEMGSRGCGVGAEETDNCASFAFEAKLSTSPVSLHIVDCEIVEKSQLSPSPPPPPLAHHLMPKLTQRPPPAPRATFLAETDEVFCAAKSTKNTPSSANCRRRHATVKAATPLVGFLHDTMALNAHQYVLQPSLRQSMRTNRPRSISPTSIRRRAGSLPAINDHSETTLVSDSTEQPLDDEQMELALLDVNDPGVYHRFFERQVSHASSSSGKQMN